MNTKLPSGYDWRLKSYADDEGIVINVTLVASTYKEGTWLDKVFGRKILNSSCEADLEATDEEIDEKITNLKTHISSIFFNQK